MPTYICTALAGALDDEKRRAIAGVVARAHHEATGAPEFFVQTTFAEAGAGCRYLGTVASDDHIWIRGDIRAGRSVTVRGALMRSILDGVARVTGLDARRIWVYLNELEPTDMIEYGHVLPAPGNEQAWFEGLPETLRDYLESLGTDRTAFRL